MKFVLLATDEQYAMPLAVTLRSLVANGGGDFSIIVLHDGVSTTARTLVSDTIGGSHASLEWIDLSGSSVGDTARHHLPPAAYYRLLADQVVDQDVERIIYLDTDTLILDDISPLWELDLGDATVGAVRSVNFPSLGTRGACDHWSTLGIDPRASYFNSGVMVIDVERWRSGEVGSRTLDYLRSPYSSGRTADQEGLNVALEGKWLALDPRWNQQTPILDDHHGAHLLYTDDQVEQARTNPAIVHFLDRPKPWHRDCVHPARDVWRGVAAATAFAPVALQRTPRAEVAKWRLKRAASALIKGR